jgi:transcriptional regulator GlxA family with amidase domain
LEAQAKTGDPLSNLLAWLPDHLKEDLSVKSMARRAAMSPRNFARVFRRQVGASPAKYIEALRFESAQRELANKGQTIAGAAQIVGLSNAEGLRRLFLRRMGVTPGQFRGEMLSSRDPL